MTTHTFTFSPKIIRQRLRLLLLIMLMVILFIAFIIWYLSDLDLSTRFGFMIYGMFGLMVAIWSFAGLTTYKNYKKLQQSTVTLTKTAIEHYDGQQSKQFIYQDIDRLVIHYNHLDTVLLIQLFTPNDSIDIWSMESMSDLQQILQTHLADTVKVEEHYGWAPKWHYLIAVMPVIIIITAYYSGTFVYYIVLILILMLSGLYNIYRLKQPDVANKQRARLTIATLFVILSVIIYMYQINLLKITIHPCDAIGRYIQKSGCVALFSSSLSIDFLADNETIIHAVFKQVKIEPLSGFGWNATRLYHDNYLRGIFSSTNGAVIATEIWDDDYDSIISVWDVPSQTIIWQRSYPSSYENEVEGIESFTLSPNGQLLALGRLHEVMLWDIATDQPTLTLPAPRPMVFSPDGSQIATTGQGGGSVDIWQVKTGQKINTLGQWERGYIRHLVYSLNGQFLLAQIGNRPAQFYIWRLGIGEMQQIWLDSSLFSLAVPAISADGRWVALGYQTDTGVGRKGYVNIWQVADGTLLKTIRLTKYMNTPEQLNFSPDSRLLGIATSGHEMLIYDMMALLGEELYEK